jgi:solute carrier family 44 protein 1 (choline transporter-like protein)
MMLRHFTAFVVWFSYFLIIGILIIISVVLWFMVYFAANETGAKNDTQTGAGNAAAGLAIVASIATIGALIAIGILYYMRKKIKLVIQLFKEASKTLIDMPHLIFQPILVSIRKLICDNNLCIRNFSHFLDGSRCRCHIYNFHLLRFGD